MPINERVMSLGDWSVRLRPDTPRLVRAQLQVPFSHVVVTPAHVQVDLLSDAAILGAAHYSGVVLRNTGYELSGASPAWWIGDADGAGATYLAPFATSGATFQAAIAAALSTALTSGSIETAGGSYTSTTQWVSRRTLLDAICAYFGREWRVNPNFTFDAGSISHLYTSTPRAFAVPRAGAKDPELPAIEADLSVLVDWEQYANNIIVIGRSQNGSATGTATFRDPFGTLATRTKVFEAAYDQPPGSEDTVASNLLATYEANSGRREVTLSSNQYDVKGAVKPGEYLYVYDPDVGLVDTANQVYYHGAWTYPVIVRCLAMTWPVEQGMGVYYRERTGTGATDMVWTDLTPYVEWETGGATLEIIAGGTTSPSLSPAPSRRTADRILAGGWDTYTPTWGASSAPSLGNGTLLGRFRRDGTTFHVDIQLTWGSTTTGGTGIWTFSLPSGVAVNSSVYAKIAGFIYDGTNVQPAVGYAAASGTVFQVVSGAGTGTGITATTPFAWANGHILSIGGSFEIAP